MKGEHVESCRYVLLDGRLRIEFTFRVPVRPWAQQTNQPGPTEPPERIKTVTPTSEEKGSSTLSYTPKFWRLQTSLGFWSVGVWVCVHIFQDREFLEVLFGVIATYSIYWNHALHNLNTGSSLTTCRFKVCISIVIKVRPVEMDNLIGLFLPSLRISWNST